MYGHSGAIRIMEGLESDITFLTSVNEGNILVGGLTDVEEHPDFMSWDLELENNKLAVCDSWVVAKKTTIRQSKIRQISSNTQGFRDHSLEITSLFQLTRSATKFLFLGM